MDVSTSTSSEGSPTEANDFTASERQQATENASECPIPVACDQNSEDRIAARDPISARLIEANRRWKEDHDGRPLRIALLELLRFLDE
jgi:hypothetical protein